MAEENFASLGRIEAINRLYEGTSFKAFSNNSFETSGRERIVTASRVLLEGMDFNLVYFPLKHLGYKSVIAVTGELYASIARPQSLDVTLGVSSKLDFVQIKELFAGIAGAARKHGYKSVGLDLVPSVNGLSISVTAAGRTEIVDAKRQPAPKSMDLVCISGNLGAAYFGLQVLEREKRSFAGGSDEPMRRNLEEYKLLVGSYLKPELDANLLKNLIDSEIYPSSGYFVTRGLGDAMKRLSRDSGLGVKVYVDRIPFAGKTFDLGRELDIDPVTAALNGGDDYRILFTVPIGRTEVFRRDFQTFDIIGHLAKPEVGQVLVTPDGLEHPVSAQGWK